MILTLNKSSLALFEALHLFDRASYILLYDLIKIGGVGRKSELSGTHDPMT